MTIEYKNKTYLTGSLQQKLYHGTVRTVYYCILQVFNLNIIITEAIHKRGGGRHTCCIY